MSFEYVNKQNIYNPIISDENLNKAEDSNEIEIRVKEKVLADGGSAIVTYNFASNVTPYYYRVGSGMDRYIKINTSRTKMTKKIESIDFMKSMVELSGGSAAIWTLNFLIKKLLFIEVENGYTKKYMLSCKTDIISLKDMSESDRTKYKRGLKKLLDANIVKKIKRGQYMINPQFIIPYNFEQELIEYEAL